MGNFAKVLLVNSCELVFVCLLVDVLNLAGLLATVLTLC